MPEKRLLARGSWVDEQFIPETWAKSLRKDMRSNWIKENNLIKWWIHKVIVKISMWLWERRNKAIFMEYAKYRRTHPDMSMEEKMQFMFR